MNLEEKLKAKSVDMQHDNVCCSCSSAVDSPPALMIGLDDALSICQEAVDEKQIELDLLKANNKKLIFMVDNGLGWKDMISDNSFSPESLKEKL